MDTPRMSTSISERLHALTGHEPVLSGIGLAERGVLPDPLLRLAMRHLCAERLRQEYAGDWFERLRARVHEHRQSPIAIERPRPQTPALEVPPASSSHRSGSD
jgi:cyclopropane-fatty-acyl-phospholipid synthase